MKLVNKGLLGAALAMLGASWFGSAQAVPAFAHKYEKSCSYCHTAWPQLNAKGRKFKEMGYRLKEDLKGETKDSPYLEGFPIGAILVSRPYDKKSNGDREMHGVHEAELFIAGAVDKNISTFVELEAEDENDWNVEFGHAVLNYRQDDAINVQLSWAPLFFADPYGTIVDHFSPTVSHYALVNGEGGTVNGPAAADFGGADGAGYDTDNSEVSAGGALGDHRHNVVVNGRINKFFYIAGISGLAGSTTGEKNSVLNGRLAYDITDNMMVGILAASGKTTVAVDQVGEKDVSFTRMGIDFMGDFKQVIFPAKTTKWLLIPTLKLSSTTAVLPTMCCPSRACILSRPKKASLPGFPWHVMKTTPRMMATTNTPTWSWVLATS